SYTILLTMDNNHKEVIANLEEKGLIFRNPESPEIYPIYQIDRTLQKKDFAIELARIFGDEWEQLKPQYKQVLNAIFWHNEFSKPSEDISANSIGTFLYLNQHKDINDLGGYESFKRTIRNVVNQLESRGFIVRKDGKSKDEGGKPNFTINLKFKPHPSLFNQ
ncbi:MAG: hypothetical protein MUC59_14540, partial [Saprospiraceae bacterium]|nr:hypothetical protein [Saprospiraceae bacterium]